MGVAFNFAEKVGAASPLTMNLGAKVMTRTGLPNIDRSQGTVSWIYADQDGNSGVQNLELIQVLTRYSCNELK